MLLPALWITATLAADGGLHATQRDRGTVVELSVVNPDDPATPLREGESAQFKLSLRDETTGRPLTGVYPNIWMLPYRNAGADEPKHCTAVVASLLTGGLTAPAAVDLNVFYVLTLNNDGTINVVDPRFSFGGTQLLSMIQLEKPGWDWTLASGGDRLLVTVPAADRVAVIDTVRWKLDRMIDAGPAPRRIVAAPDGQHVFVATAKGVAAIRASDGSVLATIPAGRGEHDLAISDDGRFLVTTNREDGTASLIDARALSAIGSIAVGAEPLSVAFSSLSGAAYIANAGGRVTVIDPKRKKEIATIDAKSGLTQIRVAPGGRFAFIPNPAENVVQIIDTASNRIVQAATITDGPFDISFTDTLAYVRRLRSESVDMIPLADLGREGAAVPVVDFPAGEYPFGKVPIASAAAGIVPAPDDNAVLVANPADDHIYYYNEGMAAPIGHFSNYGHYPNAVLVLDRSIKPARDGYGATSVLPRAGDYEVAVYVTSPRTITCFRLAIQPDPAAAARRRGMPVSIEHLTAERLIAAGHATRLAFRLRDAVTNAPRASLDDAMMLVVKAGSTWFVRQMLTATGDGRYETDFTPPDPGVYYVYVGAPSIGLKTSNPYYLTLEAR
jgi:DNA-binding beta-propeller fold protein YncE